jgi:hypothetical protein
MIWHRVYKLKAGKQKIFCHIIYKYLLICGFFNDAVSSSDYIVLKYWVIMNWKECGRKQLLSKLRYCE